MTDPEIVGLLARLELADRALASCKANAEEIRGIAKAQRHRADEAESKLADMTIERDAFQAECHRLLVELMKGG